MRPYEIGQQYAIKVAFGGGWSEDRPYLGVARKGHRVEAAKTGIKAGLPGIAIGAGLGGAAGWLGANVVKAKFPSLATALAVYGRRTGALAGAALGADIGFDVAGHPAYAKAVRDSYSAKERLKDLLTGRSPLG